MDEPRFKPGDAVYCKGALSPMMTVVSPYLETKGGVLCRYTEGEFDAEDLVPAVPEAKEPAPRFKPGDAVRREGYKFPMTVMEPIAETGDGFVRCRWGDGVYEADFAADLLRPAVPEKSALRRAAEAYIDAVQRRIGGYLPPTSREYAALAVARDAASPTGEDFGLLAATSPWAEGGKGEVGIYDREVNDLRRYLRPFKVGDRVFVTGGPAMTVEAEEEPAEPERRYGFVVCSHVDRDGLKHASAHAGATLRLCPAEEGAVLFAGDRAIVMPWAGDSTISSNIFCDIASPDPAYQGHLVDLPQFGAKLSVMTQAGKVVSVAILDPGPGDAVLSMAGWHANAKAFVPTGPVVAVDVSKFIDPAPGEARPGPEPEPAKEETWHDRERLFW